MVDAREERGKQEGGREEGGGKKGEKRRGGGWLRLHVVGWCICILLLCVFRDCVCMFNTTCLTHVKRLPNVCDVVGCACMLLDCVFVYCLCVLSVGV